MRIDSCGAIPKARIVGIHLRNEISTEFFLLFFGRKEWGYHSRVEKLMRLMCDWTLKAENLLQEGYILLEKEEVWTRRERDGDWIMTENYEDCKMLDDEDEDWIL